MNIIGIECKRMLSLAFKERWSLAEVAVRSFWLVGLRHSDSFTVFTRALNHKCAQDTRSPNRSIKYLTAFYSFLYYPNRSSVSTRRTTSSTASTPVRSPGTKPIPSHVAWQKVSCFEDNWVIISKPCLGIDWNTPTIPLYHQGFTKSTCPQLMTVYRVVSRHTPRVAHVTVHSHWMV